MTVLLTELPGGTDSAETVDGLLDAVVEGFEDVESFVDDDFFEGDREGSVDAPLEEPVVEDLPVVDEEVEEPVFEGGSLAGLAPESPELFVNDGGAGAVDAGAGGAGSVGGESTSKSRAEAGEELEKGKKDVLNMM